MKFGRRSTDTAVKSNPANPWLFPSMLLLFLLYWLFAWYMERIDLSLWLTGWWTQLGLDVIPLPDFVIFMVEMLHPRVLRHLVPLFIGWELARRAAIALVQGLYNVPERDIAVNYLRRLQSSGRNVGQTVRISRPVLVTERDRLLLLKAGGPGRIAVNNDDVVVTEVNGRFYRILGPGVHLLVSFENIRAIIDLHQQERTLTDISLVTSDGIELTGNVSVTYRINPGGEPATRARPFPFDPESVRAAAYAETVLPDGGVSTWENKPVAVAKGHLQRIVARYRLDEILYPIDSPASEPYLNIHNELRRLTRISLADIGVQLNSVHIWGLDLPPSVTEQYIKYWQVHWETRQRISRAEGEAKALEELELARAEAEVTMIQAIVEGVQRAQRDGRPRDMREIVALRLIEALEQMARQSQRLQPLPSQLLPRLSGLRNQLGPGDEAITAGEVEES